MVKKIAPKSSGNAITNFIRQEITAPEKRAGNTSIAISLTVFGLAVTFLRSLGDMLGAGESGEDVFKGNGEMW
ncbi:hypothetical protein EDD11_004082 [Mortierella claussenii]|nr:hypothetical protein EDD11_004082 [Mortierella claussenii]